MKTGIKKCVCPFCLSEQENEIFEEKETAIFKDVEVEFKSLVLRCPVCDEYYEDEDVISENDIRIKNAYREKEGLLTSDEIVALRKNTQLSRVICVYCLAGVKRLSLDTKAIRSRIGLMI